MRKFLIIVFLFFSLSGIAQQKQEVTEADYQNRKVEMADTLREEGKIYVVVAILSTILLGLIIYTIRIDNKITKIEKELNQ